MTDEDRSILASDAWLLRNGLREEYAHEREAREQSRLSAAKVLRESVEAREGNAIIWTMLTAYAVGIWALGNYAGWW